MATSSVLGMPNWLANLRSYAILFACIIVILIITRICFKCGCANWFGNYVVVSVDHRQCKVLRFPSKIVIFFSSFVRLRVIILRFRGLCNKTWKLTLQTTLFFSLFSLFFSLFLVLTSLSKYHFIPSLTLSFPNSRSAFCTRSLLVLSRSLRDSSILEYFFIGTFPYNQ